MLGLSTPEEKRARRAERNRQYYEANKEKVAEVNRQYYEANKEKVAETKRQYREANKEKLAETTRQYREANKEKLVETTRQYREAHKEKLAEAKRQYREANKEKVAETKRRAARRRSFEKEDGSSFQAWIASLTKPNKAFPVIANLTPDPNQTLAQLIHKLSGYAMDVCEQIANPPAIEDSPALTPLPDPDLF
jgi:hypothetical protein